MKKIRQLHWIFFSNCENRNKLPRSESNKPVNLIVFFNSVLRKYTLSRKLANKQSNFYDITSVLCLFFFCFGTETPLIMLFGSEITTDTEMREQSRIQERHELSNIHNMTADGLITTQLYSNFLVLPTLTIECCPLVFPEQATLCLLEQRVTLQVSSVCIQIERSHRGHQK